MTSFVSDQSAATVIIVHGAFEHSGRYDDLASQFHKDGFDVIYDDLPGQGRSPGKKGHIKSFHEYIETIQKWIEKADPDKPVFLLGHSMGGIAVIRTMQKVKPRVEGVILSSPAAGILNGAEKPMEIASYILNRLSPRLRVKASLQPNLITRNEKVILKDEDDDLILDKVSIRWYREFKQGIKEAFRHTDQFPDVPLLVMQAGDDRIVDVSKTKEWFHKIDLTEKSYKQWPGLYHEIFNEPEWPMVYEYSLNFMQLQLKKTKL
ncbi:alpha/beta hydrolase [Halobacillus yeomjeoni]|uniref:alpha/beta hydrolase n=1 Tax=Halobacillus yeomjeoni TaxID=311194 RepID=UPI001CD74006|nr:alpha/beta hydrolase [Halobacillus yeomjeoni]MCA0984469.1 alpha/beta hydrolase [Halobacillus yeomjeoni]